MKYPTITKGNIDTWEGITYSYILSGMVEQEKHRKLFGKHEKRRPYGELMRNADDLTIRLLRALKRDMRVKEKTKKIAKKEEVIPFVEQVGDHYEMIIYKDKKYIEHADCCDCSGCRR